VLACHDSHALSAILHLISRENPVTIGGHQNTINNWASVNATCHQKKRIGKCLYSGLFKNFKRPNIKERESLNFF
jgi:hypothetical protein